MYVIEDRRGRFWDGSAMNSWTTSLQRAETFTRKREACTFLKPGERVFEVELVLGKEVKR